MKNLYSPRLNASFVLGGTSAIEKLMRPSPHNRGGVGKLPSSESEALTIINSLRAEGAEPLTEADVYIHYLEAANDNFVSDRFCFLGESTLKNIAQGAAEGFAFLNSHNSGNYYRSADLPLGRTFCGRYETLPAEGEDASPTRRAVVGIYMIRGVLPNGASGPGTDDMHRMIDARTVFDCSVGLYEGRAVCDVCGHGVWDYDEEYRFLCPHLPGSTHRMTEEEIASQLGRGVTDGRASYTIEDGHANEVSAVYDGAVPGAGFVKAAALSMSAPQRETLTAKLSQGYGLRFTVSDLDSLGEKIHGDKRGKFTLTGDGANHPKPTPPDAVPPGISDGTNHRTKDKNLMKWTLKALREKLGLGENDPIEIDGFKPVEPAPTPAPADFSAQITAAITAAVAPLSAQVANLEASNKALGEQLSASNQATEEARKAAQFAANEARVTKARRQFKLTAHAADKMLELAKSNPDAFGPAMDAIEANASVIALGGAPVEGAEDVTLGTDTSAGLAGDINVRAQKLAKEQGIKLHEALAQLATDPEFAAQYTAARQEETL
jgi:hypothetical protein